MTETVIKYAIQQNRGLYFPDWVDVDVFTRDSDSQARATFVYLRDQVPSRYGDKPTLRLVRREIVTTENILCD